MNKFLFLFPAFLLIRILIILGKEVNAVTPSYTPCYLYEGIEGFYKGIVPNLIRVVPATAITFIVYENVSRALMNIENIPDKNQ